MFKISMSSAIFLYLILPQNRSKSVQGHYLNNLGITRLPKVTNQISKLQLIGLEKNILKILTMYRHDCNN